MNEAIASMLSVRDTSTLSGAIDALRELVQEIALLGLSRSSFFTKASFYGGTALRIFYNLDRYSEDMDFSLLRPDPAFGLAEYGAFMKKELESFGFGVAFEPKKKSVATRIESAFLKADTESHLLMIDVDHTMAGYAKKLPKGQLIKIKIEVDTDPPPFFETEVKYHLRPIPFSASVYAMPDLFAGKMHALLCRDWKGHVKGRDWYDMVWYVSRDVPLNLTHLEARMSQSGHKKWDGPLTPKIFRDLINARIETLDVLSARDDVIRFLSNPESTAIWSGEFFSAVTEKINFSRA